MVSHESSYVIQEDIYYGVPIVVMPVQLDQDYNFYLLGKRGIGVNLELSTLSNQQLKEPFPFKVFWAKGSCGRAISSCWKERPIQTLDSALRWTELIIRRRSSEMSKLYCESVLSSLKWLQKRPIDFWALGMMVTIMFGLIVGTVLIWVAVSLATSNESIFSDNKIE